ncbi:MAG: hypothetical protein Q7T53_08105 [Deltaproteobacteria bacterium]|nr:hypothetical protein [Deltaproteobacteria bacterium]
MSRRMELRLYCLIANASVSLFNYLWIFTSALFILIGQKASNGGTEWLAVGRELAPVKIIKGEPYEAERKGA